MAGQTTSADAGLQRRCNELRAEKAALSLQLRRKSEELATLRATLAADPNPLWRLKARELAERLVDAFRRCGVEGRISLREDGSLHELAREVVQGSST
jgi:hypothetical protein